MLGSPRSTKAVTYIGSAAVFLLIICMLASSSQCGIRFSQSSALSCTEVLDHRILPAYTTPDLPRPDICSESLQVAPPSSTKEAAKEISPSELLCRAHSSNRTEVPRLLHQSWKTHVLPQKFQDWSDSCREKHRGWEWVLWTDEDNLNLVQTYFPELEEVYHALPHNIYRADFARNLYMYLFGGVYADLDMECLQPATNALQPDTLNQYEINTALSEDRGGGSLAVFGRMGQDPSFRHSIPNAWMAATPGHSLFLLPLENAYRVFVKRRSRLYRLLHPWPGAEALTGPVMLQKSIADYTTNSNDNDGRIVILPGKYIYPYDWKHGKKYWDQCSARSAHFNSTACKSLMDVEGKGSIAITYWSHSWGSE